MSMGLAKASLKRGIKYLVWCAIIGTIDYYLWIYYDIHFYQHFLGRMAAGIMWLASIISIFPFLAGIIAIMGYFTIPRKCGDERRMFRRIDANPECEEEYY